MKNRLSKRGPQSFAVVIVLVAIAVGNTEIPGAHADAPPCRYTVGTNTVLDKETLLTWERNPEFVPRDWDGAISHCSTLDTDGGGWRLPAPAELHTLVDDARSFPSIDETVFPATPSDGFWALEMVNNPDHAWVVAFTEGSSSADLKTTMHYVRCVR